MVLTKKISPRDGKNNIILPEGLQGSTRTALTSFEYKHQLAGSTAIRTPVRDDLTEESTSSRKIRHVEASLVRFPIGVDNIGMVCIFALSTTVVPTDRVTMLSKALTSIPGFKSKSVKV